MPRSLSLVKVSVLSLSAVLAAAAVARLVPAAAAADGIALDGLLAHLGATGARLPVGDAMQIAVDVCDALAYAHRLAGDDGAPLGVVHRDVSPRNVLVSRDGVVKLTDFGVAKVATSDHRTRTGTLKGKIGYMSPEQCRGEAVDRRSDLFSAGIILYELTTGRRLFRPRQSEFEILQRIVKEDVEPPSVREPDYPLPLEEIVMRALRRDRDARYQTGREMQRDLERFAQTARLGSTAFELGEYVRAIVPPPPAFELPAPRPAPPRPPTVEPDPWDPDDGEAPNAVMAAQTATPPRPRPRRWGRAGLALIAALLIGLGVGVTRTGGPGAGSATATAPATAPATAAAAAAAEPATATGTVTAPGADSDIAVDTRRRDRADRHARHAARPAPTSAPPDAGPSLFDAPPPPAPARDLQPDAAPAPIEPPPAPAKPAPKPAAPKPKLDPGSFDAEPALASVDVDGPLGDAEIRRAVKRVLPAFRACYRAAAEAAGRTPPARAKVRFTIDETRGAQDARASGSSLPGLDACLEEAASRIKTRIAPDVGAAHVTVGVSFSPIDP